MNNKFVQLCVWPGTVMGESTPEDFEKFFEEDGFRVKFAEEVITNPEPGETLEQSGGRHDILFYVHSDDLGRFAIYRLAFGIRWWEDVVSYNDGAYLYNQSILDKYPVTW